MAHVLDRPDAPAAALLFVLLSAVTLGVVVQGEHRGVDCRRFEAREDLIRPRLVARHVPDGFEFGGVGPNEIWYAGGPHVTLDSWVGPESFEIMVGDPDWWADRFGADAAGPTVRTARLHDDGGGPGTGVLIWKQATSWVMLSYHGLTESEARRVAESIEQVSVDEWRTYRRSGLQYREVLACGSAHGVTWDRRASLPGAAAAPDTPQRNSHLTLYSNSSNSSVWVHLDEDPAFDTGDSRVQFRVDDERVWGVVASRAQVEHVSMHVVDRHGAVLKELGARVLPLSAACEPDWNCWLVTSNLDGAYEIARVEIDATPGHVDINVRTE